MESIEAGQPGCYGAPRGLGPPSLCPAATGTVECWGHKAEGQLGDVTTKFTGDNDVPATVRGLTDATAIAAGGRPHVCSHGLRQDRVLGRKLRQHTRGRADHPGCPSVSEATAVPFTRLFV